MAQQACDAPCHIDVTLKCDKQTSTTTNVVDVKWTVVVINKFRLPPTLLMTPYIPPPAQCRGRRPNQMRILLQRMKR